jgi:hypothetical protein
MDFYNLLPSPTEQVTVVGQTGSGKSVWLKKLLIPYITKRQIIIIDSKHDDVWNGMGKIVKTPQEIYRQKFKKVPVVVYRPEGSYGADYGVYDEIFEWVYNRGNTVIAVDESGKVVKNANSMGKGLDDITTRGRKREILRVFGMQRPVNVPRVMLSESSRFYVKYVVDQKDRDRLAEFGGPFLKSEIEDRWGMKYVNIATRERYYFPNPPK